MLRPNEARDVIDMPEHALGPCVCITDERTGARYAENTSTRRTSVDLVICDIPNVRACRVSSRMRENHRTLTEINCLQRRSPSSMGAIDGHTYTVHFPDD